MLYENEYTVANVPRRNDATSVLVGVFLALQSHTRTRSAADVVYRDRSRRIYTYNIYTRYNL